MTEEARHSTPIDGAPIWWRALQAAAIGIAAGLALHALLSFVVLQGAAPVPAEPRPAQCRKTNPPRGMQTAPAPPRTSSIVRAGARSTS